MNKLLRQTASSALVVATTWFAAHSLTQVTQQPPRYLWWFVVLAGLATGWRLCCRGLGLPTAFALAGQLVILVGGAHKLATGQWLWSSDSLAKWAESLTEAVQAAGFYSPPVPTSAASLAHLFLIAVLATWWVAEICAHYLQRPAIAVLSWLPLFAVPQAIVPATNGWWWYVGTAGGAISVLMLSEGHRIGAWAPRARHQSTSFSAALTALAVALGIVTAPVLALGSVDLAGFGSGRGDDEILLDNPITDMRRDLQRGDDRLMVRVATDAEPSYLRVAVLGRYNGVTWSAGDRTIPTKQTADGALPLPFGVAASNLSPAATFNIEVSSGFKSTWLPHYAPLDSISAEGDWRYDLQTMDFVAARKQLTAAGMTYSMSGRSVEVTADELDRATTTSFDLARSFRQLPANMPPIVGELTNQLTARANTSFGKAIALQKWFRSDAFVYDLDATVGNGNESLESFLAPGGRRGYCEQFASAFAVMARHLGIPARVVIGFSRPEQVAPNEYEFSSWDLHAWPELYFNGAGWVRFEPTPASRTGAAPDYTRQQPTQGPEPTASVNNPTPSANPSQPAPTPSPAAEPKPVPTPEEQPSAEPDRLPWLQIGSGLAATLLLGTAWLAPRLLREGQRRRRLTFRGEQPRSETEAAWSEVVATAIDLGEPVNSSASARSTAVNLSTRFADSPPQIAALARVLINVEKARYAADYQAPAQVVEDFTEVCRALEESAEPKVRRRAKRWPRSLWSKTRRGTDATNAVQDELQSRR